MTRLTVAILTLNEEHMVSRAIECARFADEILIVDGGSTDATVSICKAAGVRVVERPFDDFARQRNFALEQAQGDWVLFCDADERITPELATEVRALLDAGPTADAYAVPRRNLALGRWLTWHPSGAGDAPVRLARRGAVRWAGQVHEVIEARTTGRLAGHLVHLTHRSVSELVQKIDRYSEHEAAMLVERGAKPPTKRQLLMTMPKAMWRLWRSGLNREGHEGAVEAVLLAFNQALTMAKVWERTRLEPLRETYERAEAEIARTAVANSTEGHRQG